MSLKWLVIGFSVLVIGVTVPPSINHSVVTACPIITYPSLMSIEIDPESLNQTFVPDVAYLIKGTVGYKIYIPHWLLESRFNVFQQFKNRYLFGSFVVFPLKIHLSVENASPWADIAVITPDVYIDMFSNEFVYTSFDMVMTIYYDAPSEPFSFNLSAEAPIVHRIQGVSFRIPITITVQ